MSSTAELDEMFSKAETGEQFAEVCRLEAEMLSGIAVSEWPFAGNWQAYREDTYDGPGCPLGQGKTRETAIADLLEQEDAG